MSENNKDELQVQIHYALIEKLSASEQKLNKLLSLLDECVFECSIDFVLNYVNSAWTRQLGYMSEELIGMSLTNLVPEVNLSCWLPKLTERNLDENIPQRIELELLTKAGEFRWFELRMVKSGETQIIGSLFDIQDHKEMEAKLRQKEEETRKLSLVASHTSNMVIITDSSGCIEWVNNSFELITGYSKEHAYGRKPGTFLQGEHSDPAVIAKMSQAIQNKQPFSIEIINYNKEGQSYWVSIDASPVKDENGDIKHFIAIESDISQRVKAEQIALEAESNYRMVVDNISEVVLRLQPDGKILFMNHAWSELVLLRESQCLSIAISQFISEINKPDVAQALAKFHQGSRNICRLELQLECGDGTNTWVEMTMTPVEDTHTGQLTAIAATIVNVDARVIASQAMQEAKHLAEGLAEDRSRFLANISHEIRTPLNAMIGAGEILQNTGLNQEQERFANMIQSSGSALLSILDDVLTYSRFEAGAVTLESRHFDLGVCIDEAIDIVSENALTKEIELILNICENTPLNVIGDNVRLRQIIINLLANAIKFTDFGHVLIKVECVAEVEENYTLEISVADTGIGIANDKLSQLFAPFMQSDISTTRQYGGSGLGLAICHQICEAAGGRIDVRSKLGLGSTFSFQFPVDIDLENPSKEVGYFSNNEESNVWIIGRSERLNDAVIQELQRNKIQFTQFDTIENMLITPNTLADFVVVTEPQQTNLCREVLKEYITPGVPPCLITLDVLGNGNFIQTIGSNELLVNGPFKASHFTRIIEQLYEMLGKASLVQTDVQTSSPLDDVQFQKANILVVEDNQQNQIIIQQFLQLCGCRVTLAKHGVEALKKLQTQDIDIILMDVQMPVMDGLTATQHIRASDSPFRNVPIIAVTADAVYGDKERYLASGMNDYLPKPIFRKELYRLLDKYMPIEKKKAPIRNKIERLLDMQTLVKRVIP